MNKPIIAKYLEISLHIRALIRDGQLKSGQRIPSETKLSAQFSTTRVTVAHALKDLENEGLIIRRRGSGSYVCESSDKKTFTFGLLFPGLGEVEIFEPICNAIAVRLAEIGHRLLWGQFSAANWEERSMYAEKLCQQYIEQNVDGVFLAPVELASVMYETNLKIAELLDQANIPVVLIDWDIARFPDRSKFDLVGIDNRRVGYLLADHFIKKGCKRIVFVSRRLSAQTIEARIAGYMEAMNNENLSDYISVCLGEPSNPDFIETLLKPEPPEAVICGNDYTAAQLITALLHRNLHIPEDIRIAGIDDVKYAHLLAVPLTSMQQPCIAIGRSAVDAMIDRIASPEMPARSILFDTKLIVRKSSC